MFGFLLKMTNFINTKTNKLLIFTFHINIALEQKKRIHELNHEFFLCCGGPNERPPSGGYKPNELIHF